MYFHKMSIVKITDTLKYGYGCLRNAFIYRFCKWRLINCRLFKKPNTKCF